MRKEGKEKGVLGLGPLGSCLLFGPLPPAYSSTMGLCSWCLHYQHSPALGEKPVDHMILPSPLLFFNTLT